MRIVTLIAAVATAALASTAWSLDRDLADTISGVVERGAPRDATVGVVVRDIATGRDLVDIRGTERFTPASTTKLVTAAAALVALDREYRFETLLESDRPPDDDGVLRGNMYLIGSGDPDLPIGVLYEFALGLAGRGLKTVTGDVVCDESFLDTLREGPRWDSEGSNWYSAPLSALTVGDNCVVLWVRPGDVDGDTLRWRMTPPTGAVKVINNGTTGSPTRRTRLRVDRRWETREDVIDIEGLLAPGDYERLYVEDVENPPLFVGTLFVEALKRCGVSVAGRVRTGIAPPLTHRLDRHKSPPLDQTIALFLRDSDNLSAELVLKVLGAELRGLPGSSSDGRAVADSVLKSIGVDVRGLGVVDGSGLSRENRVTPVALVDVLSAMHRQTAVGYEFVSALPVAGTDGTLADRMIATRAERNVRAKTGTLSGVSALAGFVRSADGSDLAFAVMVEGQRSRDRDKARYLQDEIAELLANWSAPR
jgi:D-alanyl-D-alanine carboxypeptidase/D-alanyl-D-alanine-endopeptidase (penicillin-binding protein 4)